MRTPFLKKSYILSFTLASTLMWSHFHSDLHAEVVDRIVAVVNEKAITEYQLKELLKQKKKELAAMRDQVQGELTEEQMRTLALEKLIGETLVDKEITRRGIVVTDQDVDTAIQNILKRNNMTEEQLNAELKGKGTSLELYRKDLKQQLRTVKFMGQVIAPRVRVTDADLEDFFAKNPQQFAQYQSVEMAQVIIPLDPNASAEDILAANVKAAEVVKLARSKSNFEDLGEKYSQFPEAAKKETYSVSQLAPQIIAIVSDLEPGQVSEPIRSGMGLHVVKLYSRQTLGGEEYQAIREQIRERVFEMKIQEEMSKYVDELKDSNYVEIKS